MQQKINNRTIYSLCILCSILVLTLSSCNPSKPVIKFGWRNRLSYRLDIPKGYNEVCKEYENAAKIYLFTYPDSSILYFTNTLNLTSLNHDIKEEKYGSYTFGHHYNDNFVMDGVQKNGNYWKEIKDPSIYRGYINVPPEKKDLFDSILVHKTKRVYKLFQL